MLTRHLLEQYWPAFVAYVPHLITYVLFGFLLVFQERSWNTVNASLTLMTISYNLLHRILHLLPTDGPLGFLNLHLRLHHEKLYGVPRWLELTLEFLFEMFITVSIPMIAGALSGDWIVPPSLILYVALFFAFNHCVYYSVLSSDKHRIHHGNMTVNFIPDYLDHLFGTNSDPSYEDMNQHIPISIVSALLVWAGKCWIGWRD